MVGQGTSSELYRGYREDVEARVLPRAVKFGGLAFVSVSTLFILVDWIEHPEHFAFFLPLRLLVNVALLWVCFRTDLSRPVASAYFVSIAGTLALLAMIFATGGGQSSYYVGLVLLFMGVGVLLPLTSTQAVGLMALLSTGYVATAVAAPEPIVWKTFGLNLFFLAGAGIGGVLSCTLLDGIRFSDYQQRSELEAARDELRELDRAKSRFTANLHHELRTPLTLMLAPVEGMQSGEFGEVPEIVRQSLRTMQVNGLRLLKLINNLLDLAKIESRQLEVRRVPVDLGRLVGDVVEGARPMAERKGVALQATGETELQGFCADPDALDKVLVNLVGNALKFTESGGSITISTEATEGGVRLAVEDTGVGIPEAQLGRIFDRFAQVDDSATRKHEGTGIGLSLVKELVELHGGRVWAESEGAGRGTTMCVELPWGEPDAEADEEVLAAEGGQSVKLGRSIQAMEAELEHHDELSEGARLVELERNVGRHEARKAEPGLATMDGGHSEDTPEILVAEDNAEMRRLFAVLLGRRYRLRIAPNGRVALDAVRERAPDLILTDVMMPEMSGTELCRAVKGDEATRHIPVVLVTSKAEREMKIEGLELGADDYVAKPFHPRELLARVGSLVRLGELQGDLADRNRRLEQANVDLERALAELKEAEVQIVQAERLTAVGELAAGVAHEVNNPLNFARNSLAALRTYVDDVRAIAQAVEELDPGDPDKLPQQLRDLESKKDELGFDTVAEELAELVGITTEGLDRTQRLVGDLRDFASPRSGGQGTSDVAAGLESTLALLKHAAQDAHVELEAELPPGIPRAMGDAQELNQVFLNLLKNGIEALETNGGRIRVRLSAPGEGDSVRVEIEDDGPGVDPSVQANLFEPFVTSKPAGKGTGLGLSISQRIVREHGGEISVRSEPGAGTCFTVDLRAEGADAG